MIDEITNIQTKFLLVEKNYKNISFSKFIKDILDVLSPSFKFYSQRRGNKKKSYNVYFKRESIDLEERSAIIIKWLKEQVLKNKDYNYLIRNPKKPVPKVIRYRKKPVKRLLIQFPVRLGIEFSKLFWLHNDIYFKLNEYDEEAQKAIRLKHFRWLLFFKKLHTIFL